MQTQGRIINGKIYSVKTLIKMQKTKFENNIQKLRKDYSNHHRYKQMKHKQSSLKKLEKLPISTGNFLQPTKIISLTAQKWVLFDFYTSTYIRGYRSKDCHEMANFSKLLVFCTINTLIIQDKIDITRFEIIVTKGALKFCSKYCKLKVDDILTLQNMMYMMLMEEGQQYQLILSLNIGAYLDKKQKKQYYSVYDTDDKHFKQYLTHFYTLVNSYCKLLELGSIKYLEHDPKLRKQKNNCSAYDIALLSMQCLKIPLFMKILEINQKQIKVNFINSDGHLDIRKEYLENKAIANPFIKYFNVSRNWQQSQFMSSHCSIYHDDKQSRPIVIVLLGCYSPMDRQKDIQQVAQWYQKNRELNPAIKQQKKTSKSISENFQSKKLKTQILNEQVARKSNVLLDTKYDKFKIKKNTNPKNKLKTQA